jgi:hypothetical protein
VSIGIVEIYLSQITKTMRTETKYKFRITFVNSTWKDEDIDLIPTIKFRTYDKNINIDSNFFSNAINKNKMK